MNYACAIHQCHTARERNAVVNVERELSTLREPRELSLEELRELLVYKLKTQGMRDVAAQVFTGEDKRLDIVLNGHTVMSWTPRLN
jgi:hypothetical protein